MRAQSRRSQSRYDFKILGPKSSKGQELLQHGSQSPKTRNPENIQRNSARSWDRVTWTRPKWGSCHSPAISGFGIADISGIEISASPNDKELGHFASKILKVRNATYLRVGLRSHI
jgi:hypothetical protein